MHNGSATLGSSHVFTPAYRGYILAVLTCIYVFNSVDRSIMWVMLEPIKLDLGLTDTQLGWLSGFAFGVVYALACIPIGLLADRSVRKGIIAIAIGVWSVMTFVCGVVTTFRQLLLARFAVGAAESGSLPASLSMIADLYPYSSRATAASVFFSATPIGVVITFAAGGWIADHLGWRAAFFIAGLPGLFLAFLIWLTCREPPRGLSDGPVASDVMVSPISFQQTLQMLKSRRSAGWLLLAFTFANTVSAGVSTFMTSLLVRSHGLTLGAAATMVAFGYLATALAIPLIGRVTDRLAKHGRHIVVWALTSMCALEGFAILMLTLSHGAIGLVPLLCVFTICSSLGQSPPFFTILQGLAEPGSSATTVAIATVIQNLVAVGFGAVIVGTLSDSLALKFGTLALGYAIALSTIVLLFFAITFYLIAARSLQRNITTTLSDPRF